MQELESLLSQPDYEGRLAVVDFALEFCRRYAQCCVACLRSFGCSGVRLSHVPFAARPLCLRRLPENAPAVFSILARCLQHEPDPDCILRCFAVLGELGAGGMAADALRMLPDMDQVINIALAQRTAHARKGALPLLGVLASHLSPAHAAAWVEQLQVFSGPLQSSNARMAVCQSLAHSGRWLLAPQSKEAIDGGLIFSGWTVLFQLLQDSEDPIRSLATATVGQLQQAPHTEPCPGLALEMAVDAALQAAATDCQRCEWILGWLGGRSMPEVSVGGHSTLYKADLSVAFRSVTHAQCCARALRRLLEGVPAQPELAAVVHDGALEMTSAMADLHLGSPLGSEPSQRELANVYGTSAFAHVAHDAFPDDEAVVNLNRVCTDLEGRFACLMPGSGQDCTFFVSEAL